MLSFHNSYENFRKLAMGEYMFTKERDGSEGKILWLCGIRTCRARVYAKNDEVIAELGDHNHSCS